MTHWFRILDLVGRVAPYAALLLATAYGTAAATNRQWLGLAASGTVGATLLLGVWRAKREYRRGHLVGRMEAFVALGEAATRDWTMEDWLWREMARHHADSLNWHFHQCHKDTSDSPECQMDDESLGG